MNINEKNMASGCRHCAGDIYIYHDERDDGWGL